MSKPTKERGNVSLDPLDWATIDAHQKDQALDSRSAAIRHMIHEWREMKLLQFVPIQDKLAALKAERGGSPSSTTAPEGVD